MTTIHTNGTRGVNAPHFPGALSDTQAARLNGDESINRIIYGTYWFQAAENEREISQLVATIRQATDEMEALETKVQTAKARLRALLTQKGENWQDADGYARLMADSVRTSYDPKALDALMLRSDWWHARLKPYRREFPVRGGVQVR